MEWKWQLTTCNSYGNGTTCQPDGNASACQLGRFPMESGQPTCQPDGNGLCLSRELALIAPAPSSLPAFHCHLKGSDYTLCTLCNIAHITLCTLCIITHIIQSDCTGGIVVQCKAATSRHFANKERERADHQLWPERSSTSLFHLFVELVFSMSFSYSNKQLFFKISCSWKHMSGRGRRT